MAIFSLHHSSIGKQTHKAGTAAAHVRYITRQSAASFVIGERLPLGGAAVWINQAETADRKNARIVDKIMVALPREMHPLQRAKLVRQFCERVTRGCAPWMAAIHDKGKDANNPHAHIIIRDRYPVTGKRVIGLSERGSTIQLRVMWEKTVNAALKALGSPQRVSRLSLKAPGYPKAPKAP